jgi:hypothetical protein
MLVLSAVSRARTPLPMTFRAGHRCCFVSQSVSTETVTDRITTRSVVGLDHWPRGARFQFRIIEKQDHIAAPTCRWRDQMNGAKPCRR